MISESSQLMAVSGSNSFCRMWAIPAYESAGGEHAWPCQDNSSWLSSSVTHHIRKHSIFYKANGNKLPWVSLQVFDSVCTRKRSTGVSGLRSAARHQHLSWHGPSLGRCWDWAHKGWPKEHNLHNIFHLGMSSDQLSHA